MSAVHEGALTIGERINEAISIKVLFTVHLFGLNIPISDTVVSTWIVMAVLAVFAVLATRKLRETPKGLQIFVEYFIEFAEKFATDNMGHHGKTFVPFLGSIFLFLVTANLVPMITPMGGFGFEPLFVIKPLTRDINVTAAFAIVTMIVVVFSSIRYKGPGGFLKSFAKPIPIMLPFNALEYLIKPLSLTLRLFGNILGAYIIMQLIEIVMPVGLPPVLSLYFDLFDGLIQAVVFTFLSTVYIAEAIE
jgi:F-type H+-transporting ATPase subunit a